ncbi:MAG: hypothetical protein ABSG95_04660 [Solirubrobacteraceae bacterium]|jgi:hypothetical protein
MSAFLKSVKTDLLDRRLLPALIALGVALLAAVAYAVLGGSGAGSVPTPTAPISTPVSSAITVTQVPTGADAAVAETTGGSAHQHGGQARNPFAPLPGSTATSASGAKAAGSATSGSTTPAGSQTTSGSGSSGAGTSSGSTSSGSGSTSPSGGGSEPTTPSKPSTPPTPKMAYRVAVLFGLAPSATTPQSTQLTPFSNLQLYTQLPSSKQPVVVFRGVTHGGMSAAFTLVGEAIIHGKAVCRPSASQCQVIDLAPGQEEQLEYLPGEGQPIVYQLKVVSITASKASTAIAQSVLLKESKPGFEVLRQAGLLALPGLRYSQKAGVLVFVGRSALSARTRRVTRP